MDRQSTGSIEMRESERTGVMKDKDEEQMMVDLGLYNHVEEFNLLITDEKSWSAFV